MSDETLDHPQGRNRVLAGIRFTFLQYVIDHVGYISIDSKYDVVPGKANRARRKLTTDAKQFVYCGYLLYLWSSFFEGWWQHSKEKQTHAIKHYVKENNELTKQYEAFSFVSC